MKRTALAMVGLMVVAVWQPAAAQPEDGAAQSHEVSVAPVQVGESGGPQEPAVHAEDAPHEKGELLPPIKQGLPAMITAFVVFIFVYLVLKAKAWPVIAGGLEERSQKIRDEIAAAERARKDAGEALAGYEKSLIEARAESKKILDETKVYQLQ